VADVPAGTGMGSSGAYTVCLLKGLVRARHSSISPVDLAEAACEIEIDVLGEPVGKQDPYVAAHGGICAYTFHPDGGVEVEPLELELDVLRRLRDQLLLFYTGKARSASRILADQDARSKAGEDPMIENLHRTKELGRRIHRLLEQGELMHEHWMRKRERSPGMTSARVDHLYGEARRSGAIGGKLVGAGGGGFLLVYSRRPEDTRRAMAAAKAPELAFDFEFGGAHASEYT
jgi:D-glycero-alpha-D-manno-heptose-7-phosphate kinase